jgi:hypothetical protein
VSGGSTGPDYGTWLSHYGLTPGGNGLGTADPDNDGMNNTNEFLAGFNPTSNAAYLHVISATKSGNDIVIRFMGSNGDSSYSGGPAFRTNVLESTAGYLGGPTYSNNFVSTGQSLILSNGTGTGFVTNFTDTGAASGAAKYYRVRVLVP